MADAAMCGLDVDRVWDLTPYQLGRFFEGVRRARKYAREMQAWKLAHTLNLWSKRRVTIAKLLGRRGSVSAADYGSLEAFTAAIAEAKLEAQGTD